MIAAFICTEKTQHQFDRWTVKLYVPLSEPRQDMPPFKAGVIDLTVLNPEIADQFHVGGYYQIDIKLITAKDE